MESICLKIGHFCKQAAAVGPARFLRPASKIVLPKCLGYAQPTPTLPLNRYFASSALSGHVSKDESGIIQNVVSLVNNIIERKEQGRLFAVIQVCGKQFKVTDNDIIVLEGYWPPTIGDEIRLEKVLLVGSKEFSLIGRPILPLNQISVKGTIIEKSMSHTRTRFRYVKRKQHRRIHFHKDQQTFIRINTIEILNKVNDTGDVDGTVDRIF